MHPHPRTSCRARLCFTLACVAALAACGGGGTSSGASVFGSVAGNTVASGGNASSGRLVVGGDGSGLLPPSSTLAQQCAADNPLAPAASRSATLATEQGWVRSYVDEAYLWYDEVPAVDPGWAEFNLADLQQSLDNYFNALRTPALTASGHRRDQFSFTYPTAEWVALSESGISAGFGAEWTFGSPTPPRNIRIAYVDPLTAAANAGLARGMTLVSVDGIPADDLSDAGIDKLNEALITPRTGQAYAFVLRDLAGAERSFTLTAGAFTKTPVQNLRTLDTASGRVGYLTFNDHIGPAEGQLVAAFTSLAQQNISDLVLDLRYNGGGFLYIASQVGYMVAGDARTSGRTFERLLYSKKRQADTDNPDNDTPFFAATSGFAGSGTTADQPLPQLGLARLYVLAGPGTCSASEAIVNGLRGVGVQVVLIGDTTCGKPYGFTARDNCGLSYFPIEFSGVNQLGQGDYADGFAATCNVADDFLHALGDTAEARFAAALYHRANGSCPPASSAQAAGKGIAQVLRHPARGNRMLR
jgi:carboxyl-terminal processing protease